MAPGATTDILVGVVVGCALALLAAIGWLLRRFIGKVDNLIAQVGKLSEHMTEAQTTAPEVTRRLTDLEDVTEETRRRVDVVIDWRKGHERWHELGMRRDPAT